MSAVDAAARASAWSVLRRGAQLSPELTQGLWATFGFAVASTLGRVVVPIAVQQTLDRGLNASGGVDVGFTQSMVLLALLAVLMTGLASYFMTSRLFASAERGLATLRVKAFRHVHDLPVLTQNTERRGALVSRVTGDVDQVSQFLVFGGMIAVISVGQITVATVVMAVYSWQLTLVVWACFLPLFLSLSTFQRRLATAYGQARQYVGAMLGAISESVVGATTVRSYGVEARTRQRIDESIEASLKAAVRAQGFTAFSFSLGGISAGLANAGVIVVGVLLGVDGELTAGELLAFAFLVNLFVGPVQMGTQVLTDAQNAFAGWRRVVAILDTPAEISDPAHQNSGRTSDLGARGPLAITFDGVRYAYPGGPTVLHDVAFDIAAGRRIAVVGETGSGKTTLAKVLTRLLDPDQGRVLLNGVDLREIAFAQLRERVVLVPQEGFLFDDSLRANVHYGRLDASDEQIRTAAEELGLDDWLLGLPNGLDTQVGQRGESLSAGERQLVALLRAHLRAPDLLVLDEATSSVDPALEMRISRALERLTQGRTAVTIAHRMSTAELADEVVVMDGGVVVQRGPHQALWQEPGVYQRLYQSWLTQLSAHAVAPRQS